MTTRAISEKSSLMPPAALPLGGPAVFIAQAGCRAVQRVCVRGKFLFVDDRKFYIRGVTYGPFKPNESGCEYHDVHTVERDFAAMVEAGINTVRTYTIPPRWLLDIAQQYGLRVMVGLPWEQHIAFLDEKCRVEQIVQRVRALVRTVAGHPALLAYTIGNEIPAAIVRWHGAARIEKFLHRLFRMVKKEDPHSLATYVNYPTTEYLHLPFLDFVSFNVYLESEPVLTAYLSKLQAHAGDRPLVMAELGLDSIRHGVATQAQTLDWQIRAAFASGAAGVFTFAWTDEWFRGGLEITDWGFGLTDRQRQPKPALAVVSKAYAEAPFPQHRDWPRISVIVCTYNGSRTMRDCCEGLTQLEYPNFEVIVVDDGSTDSVGQIAQAYNFRVIRTANQGLSRARNVGLENATGEIVSYIDDDARADPHWLCYLAHTFLTTSHAAIGGPNVAPAGDGPIADCVANAPGGPIHVLITDQMAEHIPGCNFSVRRAALQAVGGFDPTFRIAGDDVDLCWRLQDQGWTIGFSHAAMVWHHRRNSMRAYLRQQRNYGRAEALLEKKWPSKYNAAGHIPWMGRLYGKGVLQRFHLIRGRIYQGMWGLAPFQSLYEPAPGLISLLPSMPDWYLIIAALGVMSVLGLFWPPLLLAYPLLILALASPLFQGLLGALNASFINPEKAPLKLLGKYALTGLLHVLQPMVRFYGRVKLGLHPLRQRGKRQLVVPRPRRLTVWQETWTSPEQNLLTIEDALEKSGAAVRRGGEWDDWDLRISGGLLGGARLRMAIEEHGQGKQQVLFRVWPTFSPFGCAVVVLFALLAVAAGLDREASWRSWVACAILGLGSFGLAVKAYRETGYALGAAMDTVMPPKK